MKNALSTYESLQTVKERRAYYQACVELMDDELREKLHSHLAPCSEKLFLISYSAFHEKKYGKCFIVN